MAHLTQFKMKPSRGITWLWKKALSITNNIARGKNK
jgi:hypothetical protein